VDRPNFTVESDAHSSLDPWSPDVDDHEPRVRVIEKGAAAQ
jgi:hypothetical protein